MPIRAPALRGIIITAITVAALSPAPHGRAAGPLVPAPSATPALKRAAEKVVAKPVLEASAAEREAAHIGRYDAAIAPARDHAVSADDIKLIGEAVARYAEADVDEARPLHERVSDPIARMLLDWHRLRAGIGQVADYRAFLDANPA